MDKGKREGGATAISLTDAAATTDSFRIWEFKVILPERLAVDEGGRSGKRVGSKFLTAPGRPLMSLLSVQVKRCPRSRPHGARPARPPATCTLSAVHLALAPPGPR